MKVGDLVKDEFGNRGIILEVVTNGNGEAALIQFDPGSGYTNDSGWVLQNLLEVISDLPS